MIKGDSVLISYIGQNKSKVATFHEESDGLYYMEDAHGIFAVSEKAVNMGEIVMEVID